MGCKAACRTCFKVSLMVLVSYCGNRKNFPDSCITLWLLWSLLLFFIVCLYAVGQKEGLQISCKHKCHASVINVSIHTSTTGHIWAFDPSGIKHVVYHLQVITGGKPVLFVQQYIGMQGT